MKAVLVLILVVCGCLYQFANAQITIQNINMQVTCCSDSDSVDIANNGLYDLKIKSMFEGIDSFNFNISQLQSNTQVQNNPIDFGMPFQPYWYNSGLIAQTSIMCFWSPMYQPNTGIKYQGIRTINAPGDTTFGWVKLNFTGDYDCNDTVFVLQVAYCDFPNIQLFAGQTILTSLDISTDHKAQKLYPIPVSDVHYLTDDFSESIQAYEIYDLNGKMVIKGSFSGNSIPVECLNPGVFFINLKTDKWSEFRKFIKQ